MQPFKVKFIYEEILSESQFNKYEGINALNTMWQQAYNDTRGNGFILWGKQQLYPYYKPQINEKFIEDYKGIGFMIESIDHELQDLGYKGQPPYNQDGYTYKANVVVTSITYTCLEILADKTFICVDTANEIKYIAGAKTKAIIQSPTL